MDPNVIKLILTNAGRKRINGLLEAGATISLMVALGDGNVTPSKESTQISNECERVEPSVLDDDDKNYWHISASFPVSKKVFDITELGLFITDSKNKINFTLLGIYHEGTAFAKKTKISDLLIDIVVDVTDLSQQPIQLEKYQPTFSIPHATSDVYGTVKLANKDDIKLAKSGLAITTDNLVDIVSLVRADAEKIKTAKVSVEVIKTSMLNTEGVFAPMGFLALQTAIYSLMLLNEEGEGKRLVVIKYDRGTTAISESAVYIGDKIVYLPSPSCGIKDDKITWLVLKNKNISQNSAWQLQTESNRQQAPKLGAYFPFDPNTESGSLLVYNEGACILGGLSKASKQLLVAVDNDVQNSRSYSLAYARKKPLVQCIQDKIYCLGGSKVGEPLVEMHSIKIEKDEVDNDGIESKKSKVIDHMAFIPPNAAILDLSNTEGWTSCVLGSCIYLFKIADYYKNNRAAIFHYYDCLANSWQTSMFSKDAFNQIEEASTYGEAVSDGNSIYLFCTQGELNKTKLTIIKLTP